MYKLFNDGWQFSFMPIGIRPADSDYRNVNLPHDWQIYNTRNLYSTGDGFYRKRFNISAPAGRVYTLRFEGVYMDSTVYLNGREIFEWKYGYTTFDVPLEGIKDGENEIIVRVRYQSPNSRWYSGAGIYRNVWQRETGESYINADGTYVVSCPDGDDWQTEIDTEITAISSGSVRHVLLDGNGSEAASSETEFESGAQRVSQSFKVSRPHLWSVDDPYLYTLKTELVIDGESVDTRLERIGFRTIRFDSAQGFFLNGENLKLNGACMHHDLGALGSAVNRTATRRQLAILKEMGVNAIRTSHNPPSVEFMELCDEMGFLVDSEGFDMWELKKNEYDYHRFFPDWHERDARSWIRRDRNHPSVIMWSIGNEIYDTHASPRGAEITKELARCVRLDDYKSAHPITIGSNYMRWEPAQKGAEYLDVIGYNYTEDIYDEHHAKHPEWIIYGSETASTVQSRGVYHFPARVFTTNYDDGQCSSLLNCATGWGAPSPEYNISEDRCRRFSLGQFIWTGFDYIGEPTPYHSKNSFFGHIDTAGFPKDTFYAYKAEWNYKAAPFVHLFPYWDFNEGQLVDIFAFSNCAKTELFVNGESMGCFEHDHISGKELAGRWQVPYHKGYIKAVGYDENGVKLCEHIRSSFGDPAKIVLTPDKTALSADGEDMAFIEVSVADRDGNTVENARNRINVEVSGAGRLLGLDNGDSTDYEQYKTNSRRLYSGRLLIMIGAKAEAGDIVLKVTSPGLPDEEIRLISEPAQPREGISCLDDDIRCESKSDISARKLELAVSSQLITPENKTASVSIRLLPENTTLSSADIGLKAVTDSGVETNLLNIEKNGLSATLTPRGDGAYRLRAYCRNGTSVEEVISEIEMENRGFGPASFDPYGDIICASVASNAYELVSNMEGGVLTEHGETSVRFDCVDFGSIGSDEITIGVYTYNEGRIPIDLYIDGELFAALVFQAKNEWNVYKYNTIKLPERLKGVRAIEFKIHEQLRFKGFKFSCPRRVGERILAAENDGIYGDSFTAGEKLIEHIGNNVNISFNGIDLGSGCKAVEITGRTHNPRDTVHLRFADGEIRMAEFEKTDGIVTRKFDIEPLSGVKDLMLVFLPGSDFDLEAIRFI